MFHGFIRQFGNPGNSIRPIGVEDRARLNMVQDKSIQRRRVGVLHPARDNCTAAMAACMFNSEMARFYRRLVERGKPHKVAVTAVMRKLTVTANALLRGRRMWEDRTADAA